MTTMMIPPPTGNHVPPADQYPSVEGDDPASDPLDTFSSSNALLEYRADHQPHRPFMYEFVELGAEGSEARARPITYAETFRLVKKAAKEFAKSFPPRRKTDLQPRVIAYVGASGVGYVINEWGLSRL